MRPTYLLLKRCLLFALFFSFTLSAVFSQTTGYSGTGKNIDVTYQRCEWRINPDSASKGIKGNVTVYFVTKAASVSSFTLDLRRSAFNGSVSAKYHGAATTVTFPTTGDSIRISLPSSLALNTFDSVTISYSGAPPAVAGQAEGYQKKVVNTKNMIYTLSESYEDRDWWPCKADMQDKIDSLDIYINVPSTHTAAANGVLMSTTTAGSNRIFHYRHRYPIASYLIAVAVSEYTINNRGTVNINGTNMPVDYYYLSNRSPSAAELQTMDRCKDELIAFSSNSIFGDYPFKNEKYGMYEFGWGGGMEHQTFSAMSWGSMISWSVIAHELGHQWFGDKVTFGTWNHLWLAEGFAKYSEALAAEMVSAMGQNARTHRSGIKTTALATSTTPIYISNANIANSNLIWTTSNDNAIYQRGAMVVSMLRKLAGDTKFFQALRNYLNDPTYAYKSATTENLRDHFEAVVGYDLDAFFQDYIYGTGNPAYDINWGSNGNSINIELTTQRRSASSTVSYFRTPVVLTIFNTGKTQSQKVVIYDQNGQLSYAGNGINTAVPGKVLGYNLPFTPASVEVDPDYETLVRGQDATANQSTVTRVARLNVNPIVVLPVKIIDFKGSAGTNGNLLSLAIAESADNAGIVLERSDNGNQFYTLGNMVVENISAGKISYSFLDKDIFGKDVYYYRVKATDVESVVNYSKTISISRHSEESDMKVYPNPADNEVSVRWNNGSGDLRIITMDGHVAKTVRSATNTATLSVADLPAGLYLVELRKEGIIVARQKLVVKR